jgi:hypothetical protein
MGGGVAAGTERGTKSSWKWSHSQNSVSFGNGFGKSGQKSAFSSKSKLAFPKTEVLGKPHTIFIIIAGTDADNREGLWGSTY